MKISYNWLKEYLDGNVPDAPELSELFNTHSYEVEGIENLPSGDVVLDIDILPNRASDSLSHRGVAKEVSTITNTSFVERKLKICEEVQPTLNVKILSDKKAPRYIGRLVRNIKLDESPLWLKDKLTSLGQRPINNIVDILNYVMFDVGQPMHAFDADKVEGDIVVREATQGEEMITLDDKKIVLNEGDLVITDDKDILAIAGVKGGKKAEVDSATKNIILEAACFNQVAIRVVSRRLPLITDASKRFENGVAPELSELGMNMATSLISELASSKETVIESFVDVYPRKRGVYKLGVSLLEVNRLLGTEITKDEVEDILHKLSFPYEILLPRKTVVNEAARYEGVPYKYGASITYDAPRYFDCSSFTAFLYARAGVSIPRMTVDQFVYGREISYDDMRPGDVIFSQTADNDKETSFELIQENHNLITGKGQVTQRDVHHRTREFLPGTVLSEGVSHNGIYLGNDEVIHASGKWYKGEVVKERLSTSPAFQNVRGYRRMTIDEERYVIEVPKERLDLRIKEDLIEEIGRIYGLNRISSRTPDITERNPSVNKDLYFREVVKDTLYKLGLDEVYTYSFVEKGDVELLNPVSKEQPYLRPSMKEGLAKAYKLNVKNKPLLGIERIRIFEIGKVFSSEGESLELGIVLEKNDREILEQVKLELCKILGETEVNVEEDKEIIFISLNLTRAFNELVPASKYGWQRMEIVSSFEKISNYPYILRDIALWIPNEVNPERIVEVIETHSRGLLKRIDMFDKYTKDNRTSYAYHLVFQSGDKTLTDDEINEIMEEIYGELKKLSFEIR